jgi:predicted DNA binding CopG/RHH family protein
MKSRKNPYVKALKQPVTLRLDCDRVMYFKELAAKIGMPYQQLINFYLRDCVINRRELALQWR